MSDKEVEQIEKQAREALDKSAQRLSPDVQQKLFEARQTALASRGQPGYRQALVGFAIAASFSAILLVNYLPVSQNERVPELADSSLEDFMYLSQLDETDLAVAEDIEFAYWLSEQFENDVDPETLSRGDLHNG